MWSRATYNLIISNNLGGHELTKEQNSLQSAFHAFGPIRTPLGREFVKNNRHLLVREAGGIVSDLQGIIYLEGDKKCTPFVGLRFSIVR